jgi:precorrin-6B methylase 2
MSDDKKKVCLGMPCYGQISMGAARGFYRPSNGRFIVEGLQPNGSLLTQNMNICWAWALNRAKAGECNYFAMQHSDIMPEDHWLDKLIDELEASKLDVLGVVAPIKDVRGLTSTALAKKNGDSWDVHCRLSMREVHRLPETFTSADVNGFPLLLNTGLWVCKFDEHWEEWARQVYFTVNDRIMLDSKGNYFAQVEPEDWFVSRVFNELGLRIGATRKVALIHTGNAECDNAVPWGRDEFDKEHLSASVLAVPEPAKWFPHDAAGWLTEEEGEELARLAEDKAVLEIGAYCGRSTICLAQRAKTVAVVDTFDGRGTANEGETFELFRSNIRRYGVGNKVRVYQGTSEKMLPLLPPVYDLIFIDASHDYDSVMLDAELATARLREDGLLVFHDYGKPDENADVTEAVNELIDGGAELVSRCGSLAVVRPTDAEKLLPV